MKVIETRNLTKYYGKTRGILDLNLEVEEGDIFGFIGPNGAGKSTAIRTFLNLIFPSRGSAKVLGMDIIKDSKEIRQNIGYIPSEINYYSDLSVLELLNYSASFYAKSCELRIKELGSRFELDLSKKIAELSYGNKRKVAIVQALLHSPRLLMLDEPSSGLDPLMQNVFFETLRDENQRGVTIFFSSHVLSEVQRMCNIIAIIKQGRILQTEQVDQLRNRQFKTITVEFSAGQDTLLDVDGLIKTENNGQICKYIFKGDIKNLLYNLSLKAIDNLLIEEPSLEEIFMHYYEREED